MTLLPFGAGGRAALASLDGDAIAAHATIAGAPGSRPAFVLPSGEAARIKVHRCRSVDAGAPAGPAPELRFFLEGRLLDASRAVRAEIEALLASSTEGR
jgi:hypothetical protein